MAPDRTEELADLRDEMDGAVQSYELVVVPGGRLQLLGFPVSRQVQAADAGSLLVDDNPCLGAADPAERPDEPITTAPTRSTRGRS